MFKIIAIICTISYGGVIMECTKLLETDKRTFHTEEACIEEAGYKYNQLANILTEYPNEQFTLKVYCEPSQKDGI